MPLANNSFENVVNFNYLESIPTDPHYMQEDTKSRRNSGNAYNRSAQNLLFKIYGTKT
jgi:hypothetical protein